MNFNTVQVYTVHIEQVQVTSIEAKTY